MENEEMQPLVADSKELPKYRRGSEVNVINSYASDQHKLKKELDTIDRTKETAGIRLTKEQLELVKKMEALNTKKAQNATAMTAKRKESDAGGANESSLNLSASGSSSAALYGDSTRDTLLDSFATGSPSKPAEEETPQEQPQLKRRRSLSAMSNWKPVSMTALAAQNAATVTEAATEGSAEAAGAEGEGSKEDTVPTDASGGTRLKRSRSFSTGSGTARRNSVLGAAIKEAGALPEEHKEEDSAYYIAQRKQALDDLDNEFLDPSFRFRKEIQQLNALNQLTTDLQKKRSENEQPALGGRKGRKTSVDLSATLGLAPNIGAIDKRPTPSDFVTQRLPQVPVPDKQPDAPQPPPPTLARRMSIHRGILLEGVLPLASSSSNGSATPPTQETVTPLSLSNGAEKPPGTSGDATPPLPRLERQNSRPTSVTGARRA